MSLTARKTRFYGLVLVLTSLIVSMGLGEIVLRLISSDQYYVWPPGLRNIFHPAPDVMPGINGESRFSINDQGLRGDPFSENQTYRILAIGGSTTECLYLDDLEAWPYLLQEALNATADPKRRVWVGNAGRSGHNTRHHLVQAEMLTRQYPKIDAVLLLIGANDFWQRISMDQKFRPFPGVEKLPLDEYEALMDRAFSAWPRADSHFPFFKRTAIWRTAREVRKRYLNPPKPEAMQDDAGLVYKKWRTHRALAGSIRSSLPDLAPALEEYSKNVNTLIDYAKSKKTRIILVTQPHMWNPGMPSEEQALLWGGGSGLRLAGLASYQPR